MPPCRPGVAVHTQSGCAGFRCKVYLRNQAARVRAGFFAQFGRVTKVRVSRNKKTGAAKHYAFLEFASAEVAAIAAEAMDGYMLFTQARLAST